MIDISNFAMSRSNNPAELKQQLIDILKDSSIKIRDVSFTSYGKGRTESFHIEFLRIDPAPEDNLEVKQEEVEIEKITLDNKSEKLIKDEFDDIIKKAMKFYE